MNDRAEFIGWQEGLPGFKPLALYNVTDPTHPQYRSTLSAKSLGEAGIPVPYTPPYPGPKKNPTIHRKYKMGEAAPAIFPREIERQKIIDGLKEKYGTDVMYGQNGFFVRGTGWISMARARRETGLAASLKRPGQRVSSYGDYAIVEMLNRPRTSRPQPIPQPIKKDMGLDVYFDGQRHTVYNQKQLGAGAAKTFAVSEKGYGTVFETDDISEALETAKGLERSSMMSRHNPSQPKTGGTSVKAIFGNIPAPRSGMMHCVNPSAPRGWVLGATGYLAHDLDYEVRRGVVDHVRSRTRFTVTKLYKVGGAPWIAVSFDNGKHLAVALSDLMASKKFILHNTKSNPSKMAIYRNELDRHYATLVRLAVKLGVSDPNGKKLSLALWKLEQLAHKGAEDLCNGIIEQDQWEKLSEDVTAKVQSLFSGRLEGFFVNGDPRGYALKIDDSVVREKYADINLHRDMGGYGILSPEIERPGIRRNPHEDDTDIVTKLWQRRGMIVTLKFAGGQLITGKLRSEDQSNFRVVGAAAERALPGTFSADEVKSVVGKVITFHDAMRKNPSDRCRYCGRPDDSKSGVCDACYKKYESSGKRNPGVGGFEYETADLRTIQGIKKAERLKSDGWKAISHGLDTIDFERPKKRNPGPRGGTTAIQSLLFDVRQGWTPVRAQRWASSSGFRAGTPEIPTGKANFIRIRQVDPHAAWIGRLRNVSKFSHGGKFISLPKGVQAIVAIEKGMERSNPTMRFTRAGVYQVPGRGAVYYDKNTANVFWFVGRELQAAAQNANGTIDWSSQYDPDGLSMGERSQIEMALRRESKKNPSEPSFADFRSMVKHVETAIAPVRQIRQAAGLYNIFTRDGRMFTGVKDTTGRFVFTNNK